jgi:hypothetical protein
MTVILYGAGKSEIVAEAVSYRVENAKLPGLAASARTHLLASERLWPCDAARLAREATHLGVDRAAEVCPAAVFD